MIGRAAQGRPWIFREIAHFLSSGVELKAPTVAEARAIVLRHLDEHYSFYGSDAGVRIARKHIGWYAKDLAGGEMLRREVNGAESTAAQTAAVLRFFDRLASLGERLDYVPAAAGVVDARAAFGARISDRQLGGEALAA
jgi:tRNA-dihydrouridine synthase B